MRARADILENDIREKYPEVLEILLYDQTTHKNIFWATDNYQELGKEYEYYSQITTDLITGENGQIIMPRVKKNKKLQRIRARDMAEVFTPSWICNAQNNLIDNAWFGVDRVFNTELRLPDGRHTWRVNKNRISFPKDKTWRHYVKDIRLEMTCGEAPYITSRYDTTTGKYIPIEIRIGLLDRKLRVVNENVGKPDEWLDAAQTAYCSIYAFEWQGDSLLLAREAALITFIENYTLKFDKEPLHKDIKNMANIISWNIWQMDGLKGVVPNSCGNRVTETTNLFGDTDRIMKPCEGCLKDNIHKHNGQYCLIKEWDCGCSSKEIDGKIIKFVDVLI